MAIHADYSTQILGEILDYNKELYTHNDGYNAARNMRRAASIPPFLRLKWLFEEGWDAWKPEHKGQLTRKLNDPDYRYLRTAPGRL